MAETLQLQSLVRLLHDDSPVVQAEVASALASYGPRLGELLAALDQPLSEEQWHRVLELLQERERRLLEEAWPDRWLAQAEDKERLEEGLVMLSDFMAGPLRSSGLRELLDGLAEEYRRRHRLPDALGLARFLFEEKGFRGNREDYDNPRNSDLAEVIRSGRGLPLSLACLYLLVGRRLGLEVEGVDLPGHFLVRARAGSRQLVLDCFAGGKVVEEEALLARSPLPEEETLRLLRRPPDAAAILARVLRNLWHAYRRLEAVEELTLVGRLQRRLEERRPRPEPDPPLYSPGQLVRHRRYGYRGVIVDLDLTCQASEEWYRSNRTQPDRNQPWYHVLVDGSPHITYAAQTSLLPDDSGKQVRHHLLPYFFSGFENGRYLRNDRPWPRGGI